MALKDVRKKLIIGISVFTFASVMRLIVLPMSLKSGLKKQSTLRNGTVMRDFWGKVPFPLEFKVYIFNYTNTDEIANGAKPSVQEIGPFIYDLWYEKVNQVEHEDDDTVSYNSKKTYYFNVEKSKGLTEDQEVVIPHINILGGVNVVKHIMPNSLTLANSVFKSIYGDPKDLFLKVKVRDLLFDGLITDCSNITDFAGNAGCQEFEKNVEKYRLKVVSDKVYAAAFFGPDNGTISPARWKVKRGMTHPVDVGELVEYNGKKSLDTWDDERCDNFNGTDGTVFHPFFDKKGRDLVLMVTPGICRNMALRYDSMSYKYDGINLLRYTMDFGVYPKENERDRCYCQKPNDCLRDGAYDLFKCTESAVTLTNPHFYRADPYYLNSINGLDPEQEKHMTMFDLDPDTGAPLFVHARLQFNFFVNKTPDIPLMVNYPDALMPLMWVDESLEAPKFLVDLIKQGHKKLMLYNLAKHIFTFMMGNGLVICAYASFLYYKMKMRKIPQVTSNPSDKTLDNHNSTS